MRNQIAILAVALYAAAAGAGDASNKSVKEAAAVSQAAADAAAFYRDVDQSRRLWTIRDAEGFPAPLLASGARAQPFWSSQERAERVIATVDAYAGFKVVELSWSEFVERWVPGLSRDGILVGVNWSGPRAVGFDLKPDEVVRNVNAKSEGR